MLWNAARRLWLIVLVSNGAACQSADLSSSTWANPLVSVDPFIGTGGMGFNQGQTFVGPTVPFGMVKPGPDSTGYLRLGRGMVSWAHTSGYWHADNKIEGFSQLHFSGTGIEDYGNFLLMPTDGMDAGKTEEEGYAQEFSHEQESASPGHYGVTLLDTGIRVDLSASAHASHHRYIFPSTVARPTVLIDVSHGIGDYPALDGGVTVDRAAGTVEGWMQSGGRFTRRECAFPVYFSAKFSANVSGHGVWQHSGLHEGEAAIDGPGIGAWVEFLQPGEVQVRIGVSYVDIEQARLNRQEIDDKPLAATILDAEQAWMEYLGAIEVRGGSGRQQRIFYTALYHSLLMPTLMTEGGRYVGLDRNVHAADFSYYSDMSMWDTYRTVHPLISLLYPDRATEFAKTLLAMRAQHGKMVRWPLAVNETGTMLGTPAAIILADTALRDVDDFDVDGALAAALEDANSLTDVSSRPPGCVEHGYCPEDEVSRGTSWTLELGWADFAIANLADRLGDMAIADDFRQRARAYENHWDAETGFLRGVNTDGTWSQSAFSPENQSDDYAEGNAWQYLWAVPFDVTGLAALFGGREVLLDRLTGFFEISRATPTPMVDVVTLPDTYYWHGNEPDIHAPFLFALAGEPGLGGEWVDWVRETRYDDAPIGLAGNDDAGTLSAWYVFASLGFYPLAGSELFLLCPPIWDEAIVHLPASDLRVVAQREKASDRALHRASFNGRELDNPWISHAELAAGGELVLEMRAKSRGWSVDPYPALSP
ncbi:MAG: hypothetical protein A2289_25810 [Deltaproteobacteria bacterium RIFOXYA12_FULL_58_15]|nr:MAG: hypothetical protein A2289_25810 [Deltaproteobacteria bacterium RIFOXYA12_FULL_58_15]OGR11444.1 MAG: hypothetical protein A2341_28245 [Deltaproteobacteria bacterium RIFOXYB12_FULL_58_9]